MNINQNEIRLYKTVFNAKVWKLPLLLTIFLILVSFYHYLLFHTLAEFFAISVGLLMFVVAYITYKHSKNHFLMFLATGYFWIAALDFIHTIVYKGMMVYPFDDPNMAPQFWIATRYLEALLLFTAPFYLSKQFNHKAMFVFFGLLFTLIYTLIMTGNFPDAFVEGQGLTDFKVNSEYIINTILLVALIHIRKFKRQIGDNLYPFLTWAIIFTICAEFAFTFYVDLYGISNLVGHIFKLFSFWLVFYSIVRISLREPYDKLEQRVESRTKELKKNMDRLSKAETVSHFGSWDWDIQNNKLYWTDEIYRIFGVKPQEFKADYDTFLTYIHPNDREKVHKAVNDALTNDKPYEVEHRVIRKDGNQRIVRETGEVQFDIEHKPLHMVGIVHDVTEQIKAERALQQSEERFELAMRGANDGLWDWNLSTNKIYYSPRWINMLGYHVNELEASSKTWETLVHPDDKPEILKLISKSYINRENAYNIEVRMLHKKKDWLYIQSRGFILCDDNGHPIRLVGIHSDITESRRIQKALELSERNYRMALDAARAGTLFLHLPTDMLQWDARSMEIFGVSLDSFGGNYQAWADLVHPEDLEKSVNHVETSLASDNDYIDMRYRIITPQGEVKYIWANAYIIRDEEQVPISLTGLHFDETEAVRNRQKLEKAIEQAESANKAKSIFLANMSHEIRTPLNAVLGFAQILQENESNQTKRSYLDSILTSGNALLALINDILDISKVEAGKIELNLVPVSISRLFSELQNLFYYKAKEKSLLLTFKLPEQEYDTVMLDKVRIRQVLINLIGNALKFTEQGEVEITAQAESSQNKANCIDLSFKVNDTGVGILPSNRNIIFDAFEQTIQNSDQEKYSGTGLGLTISKRLIEVMGGQITVEGEFGQGSLFTVFIPEIPIASDFPDLPAPQIDLDRISFKHTTVLVADDCTNNRDVLVKFLEGFGFEILEACDGDETIEMALSHHPEVILLDIRMPGKDGYEVAHELRIQNESYKPILIAVTATTLKEEQEKIAELCHGYLAKPVIKVDLINELMAHLEYSPVETIPTNSPMIRDNACTEELIKLHQDIQSTVIPSIKHPIATMSFTEYQNIETRMEHLLNITSSNPLDNWFKQYRFHLENFDMNGVYQSLEELPELIK